MWYWKKLFRQIFLYSKNHDKKYFFLNLNLTALHTPYAGVDNVWSRYSLSGAGIPCLEQVFLVWSGCSLSGAVVPCLEQLFLVWSGYSLFGTGVPLMKGVSSQDFIDCPVLLTFFKRRGTSHYILFDLSCGSGIFIYCPFFCIFQVHLIFLWALGQENRAHREAPRLHYIGIDTI